MRRAWCRLPAIWLLLFSSPAKADNLAVLIFANICVGEQIYRLPPQLSMLFPDAKRVTELEPFTEAFPNLKIFDKEEWVLNPNQAVENQFLLVFGRQT